jgi:hypothetical protein
MDGMCSRFLGTRILPAVHAAMVLPVMAFASVGLSAPIECSNFSGNWGISQEAPYPGLARVEIKDCEIFTMDKTGYWNTLTIGGQATEVKVYDNELYTQTVRGTWNQDRTELMIEEFNKIEAGFNPAFGSGGTRFVIEKWTLDPKDEDILHIVINELKFTRDTGKVESKTTREVYYRYKGPAQEPIPTPIPGKPA